MPLAEFAAAPQIVLGAAAAASTNSARLALKVIDSETQLPLPEVRLTLHEITVFPTRSTNVFATDRTGVGLLPRPTAEVPYWNYRVELYRDGYVPKYVSWSLGQGDLFAEFPAEYTAKLDRATPIGGLLQNENKEPIAGAIIMFSVNGPSPGAGRERERLTMMGNYHSETTDAEGRWRCNHVPKNFGPITWRPIHPEYQEEVFQCDSPGSSLSNTRRLPASDFLAGTVVMVLKRGLKVEGVVADQEGRPVPGAKVTQDHKFRYAEAQTTTDERGHFLFQNGRAKELVLTVQAEGYAPTNFFTKPEPDMQALSFALPPGNLLRVQVVDDAGVPITTAVAEVSPDQLNFPRFWWVGKTTAPGQISWNSAPFQEEYQVSARGYEGPRKLKLVADGTDQRVVLKRESTRVQAETRVFVKVVDAVSKLPIESFKVLVDYTRIATGGSSASTYSVGAATGREGEYKFKTDGSIVSVAVAVDAAGYYPARSTNSTVGMRELTINLELVRASNLSGMVQTPDSIAVSGAAVILCAGRDKGYMRAGGILQASGSRNESWVETDKDGQFSLGRKTDERAVVIGHKLGFAEASVEQVQNTGVITLRPWGRIEGVLRLTEQTVKGQTVEITNMRWRYGPEANVQIMIEAVTDAEGRFVFDGIPPGEHRVEFQPGFRKGKTGIMPLSHGVPIVVKAGETSRVALAESGRTLKGQVSALDIDEPIDWLQDVHQLTLKLHDSELPKRENYTSQADFYAAFKAFGDNEVAFWSSDEGKAVQRASRRYVLLFKKDRSFQVEKVPPGTYQLEITPRKAADANPVGLGEPYGTIKTEITVPAGDEAVPVDLGTLKLVRGHH